MRAWRSHYAIGIWSLQNNDLTVLSTGRCILINPFHLLHRFSGMREYAPIILCIYGLCIHWMIDITSKPLIALSNDPSPPDDETCQILYIRGLAAPTFMRLSWGTARPDKLLAGDINDERIKGVVRAGWRHQRQSKMVWRDSCQTWSSRRCSFAWDIEVRIGDRWYVVVLLFTTLRSELVVAGMSMSSRWLHITIDVDSMWCRRLIYMTLRSKLVTVRYDVCRC